MSDIPKLPPDDVDPEDKTEPDIRLERPRDPGEDLLRCLIAFGELRADRPSDDG